MSSLQAYRNLDSMRVDFRIVSVFCLPGSTVILSCVSLFVFEGISIYVKVDLGF